MVAVVTGANRGISLEVVRQLAARGGEVVLAARDGEAGQRAADGLGELAGEVRVRELDVSRADSLGAFADAVRTEGVAVDALVDNAGVHYDTGQNALDADLQVVEETLAVDLLGAWRTTVAPADLMPSGARVVMVSSGAGSFGETGGGPGVPAYSVSKAPRHAHREAGRRPGAARRPHRDLHPRRTHGPVVTAGPVTTRPVRDPAGSRPGTAPSR